MKIKTPSKRSLLFGFAIFVLVLFTVSVVVVSSRMQVKNTNQIANNLAWSAPAFSQKGNAIAFFQGDNIIITDLNGAEQKRFSVGQHIISNIQWLSDYQIIYVKRVNIPSNDTKDNSQFWILDVISGENYPIDDEAVFPGWIEYFSISPSRTNIAFSKPSHSGDYENNHDLHVLDLENNSIQSFSSPPSLVNCTSPTWSFDNTKILSTCPCLKKDEATCSSQVWLLNTDTEQSEAIKVEGVPRNLSLSPDGQWLIYLRKLDTLPPTFNYYLAPVRNGIPSFNRSYRLDLSGDFWINMVFGQNHFELPPSHVAWSPDSKHITFSGDLRTKDGFEKGIWYVTLDN